jgi:hypothetical protein
MKNRPRKMTFVTNAGACMGCGNQGRCQCGNHAPAPRFREPDLLPELTVNSRELDGPAGAGFAYQGDCLPQELDFAFAANAKPKRRGHDTPRQMSHSYDEMPGTQAADDYEDDMIDSGSEGDGEYESPEEENRKNKGMTEKGDILPTPSLTESIIAERDRENARRLGFNSAARKRRDREDDDDEDDFVTNARRGDTLDCPVMNYSRPA